MKKISLILTLLAATSLAACGVSTDDSDADKEEGKTYPISFETEGGSEDEQTALLEAVNKTICTKNANATILPKKSPTFSEDSGDYIKVTTKQGVTINKKSYTVELEWAPDTSSKFYKSTEKSDDQHDIIYLQYYGYGAEGGTFTWDLKSATCGDASSAGDKIVTYKGKVENEKYKHDNVSIADIISITDEPKTVVDNSGDSPVTYEYPSTFDIVDYEFHENEKYSPYFITNNPGSDSEYYYVNVPGKVVYLAPDGNWGLIANGDDFLEIYAGSGTPLTTKNYPNFAKEYVVISGNVSQYCGNIQLGFITQVNEATEAQKATITEPSTTYKAIDSAMFDEMGSTAPQKQAIVGLQNSLATFTGTYVAGSLKNSSGESISASSMIRGKARYSFKLEDTDGNVLTVAYDYHVNPTDADDTGVLSALKSALGSGKAMTIKGTMRYNGRDEGASPFILDETNPGVWNIVPFLAEHISVNN